MQWTNGQYLKHPSRPGWGVGKIVEVSSEGKLRVEFGDGEFRTLSTAGIPLELVDAADAPISVSRRRMDMEKLDILLRQFESDMAGNRAHYNDAGLAEKIREEINRRGELTLTTRKRLIAWCHTDGSAFQGGVQLARDMSTAIYGYVLPDE